MSNLLTREEIIRVERNAYPSRNAGGARCTRYDYVVKRNGQASSRMTRKQCYDHLARMGLFHSELRFILPRVVEHGAYEWRRR